MDTQVLFFIAYAVGLAGQVGDCYTTEVGLTHGLAEGNSIAKWLVSKIGNTGITLLKCVGFATVAPMLTLIFTGSAGLGSVVCASAAVVGWVATVQNYLLLRKNKIAL